MRGLIRMEPAAERSGLALHQRDGPAKVAWPREGHRLSDAQGGRQQDRDPPLALPGDGPEINDAAAGQADSDAGHFARHRSLQHLLDAVRAGGQTDRSPARVVTRPAGKRVPERHDACVMCGPRRLILQGTRSMVPEPIRPAGQCGPGKFTVMER